MSRIVVDVGDPTPPYEQIRRGVLEELRVGNLDVGDRLPTVRALARDLGLAPGTVARAYKELEAEGVIRTARGAGTRIAQGAAPVRGERSEVEQRIGTAVEEARERGWSEEQILRAVRAALDAACPRLP